MRRRTVTIFPLLMAASVPSAERVVPSDGVVPVAINGVAGRLRLDPSGTAMPLVTADYAARAGLRAGPLAIGYAIGPTVVRGRTAIGRIDIGTGSRKRRIGWMPQPYAHGIDGLIGPGAVTEPVVRFVLAPARPGERTTILPMIDAGGLFGGWGGLYATIDLGGTPLRLRFDPHHPRTLASAGAANRIAALLDGRLVGQTAVQEIAFGIERPVRTMVLSRPLVVGSLRISSLGVRTGDFGDATGIRQDGADPDEIVVTAKGKRDASRDRVSIGADVLSRCSSLVFDKPARRIRLTCG